MPSHYPIAHYLRLPCLVLFIILQSLAPLLHAHMADEALHGLHVPELEWLSKQDHVPACSHALAASGFADRIVAVATALSPGSNHALTARPPGSQSEGAAITASGVEQAVLPARLAPSTQPSQRNTPFPPLFKPPARASPVPRALSLI